VRFSRGAIGSIAALKIEHAKWFQSKNRVALPFPALLAGFTSMNPTMCKRSLIFGACLRNYS
jgi:hypothetical protein